MAGPEPSLITDLHLEALSLVERSFAQPLLAVAGLTALLLASAGLAWSLLDHRIVHGEVVGLKPTKFALSIGVYLLTVSWMLGYARPDRLGSTLVQVATWGLLIGAGVELACIFLQAARGRASHFNMTTAADAAISGLMAILAVLFVGMLLPLAWEIARRPGTDAPGVLVAAIVIGLIATFLLGALTGAAMGRGASGAAGRQDVILPIIGWRLTGGTVRIAHFLGIHALQAIPSIGAAALLAPARAGPWLLAAGTLGYVAATVFLLHQPAPKASIERSSPATNSA